METVAFSKKAIRMGLADQSGVKSWMLRTSINDDADILEPLSARAQRLAMRQIVTLHFATLAIGKS